MHVSPNKKECAEKDSSERTRIRSARRAQGRVICPFFDAPKSLPQGAHPLNLPHSPGPAPNRTGARARLTWLSLAVGVPPTSVPRSGHPFCHATHGPVGGPHSRGKGRRGARGASPPPPSSSPPPRGALARDGARALRSGTRAHGAHPSPRLGGRVWRLRPGSASGVPRPASGWGGGPRSRLGHRGSRE